MDVTYSQSETVRSAYISPLPPSPKTKRPLVPKDVDGKPIPWSQRWGYLIAPVIAGRLQSQTVVLMFVSSFFIFNSSQVGHDFYDNLDRKYGASTTNLWGTFIITSVFYWAWAAFFAIPDLTGWPKCVFTYKTQPFVRLGGREYLQAAAVSIRNQLFVVLPVTVLNAYFTPKPVHSASLPGPLRTLLTIIFDVLFVDFSFYYCHRALHSKLLYSRLHKKHHEFAAPIGLSTTYCTMTEHFFTNLLPNILATMIVPHHWSLFVFVFLLLEFQAICVHSGYNIPFLSSNLPHDFHHFSSNECFGWIGLLDTYHGTNIKFRRTLQEARHEAGGDEERARKLLLERLATIEAHHSS